MGLPIEGKGFVQLIKKKEKKEERHIFSWSSIILGTVKISFRLFDYIIPI